MLPPYEVDHCHQLMIERVEDLLAGKIKRLAIIAPPRHGKTTLCNVLAPAYALGRNPLETIITVSYGSELSEGFGRRVRNILGDPAFREVFPRCQLSPDSAAAYRFTTTAGGEYSAVGRGGPVTGRGASLLVPASYHTLTGAAWSLEPVEGRERARMFVERPADDLRRDSTWPELYKWFGENLSLVYENIALKSSDVKDGPVVKAQRELGKVRDEMAENPEPDKSAIRKWLEYAKKFTLTCSY